ncbi:SgcJ/EcaC family oxidoreductase [Buttiauxella gaviniae]|uniref:SgcJ/EcaC family oxidoreductase n=1 Tax=Buttiauxella gaviniae TaxID=82990 RepID=A0ABV3NW18_9ENTR
MRLAHKAMAVTLFCLSSAAIASPAICHKAEKQDIENLFERWNKSLQTGDAHKVAANYLSDSVLLPTVSNKVRLTEAERVDYFEHFLEKKPQGKIDSRTIHIDCNTAMDNGTYTFTFADKTQVSARYSFTYRWDGNEWLISSHHSSAMPEKV